MTSDKFVTAAVAGHADHGKTTFVRCLMGIQSDPHNEPKGGGLSLETSFGPFRLASGVRIALVDVPNRSDFSKKTSETLHSFDLAVLVVAADDGVMPGTKDDLEVLNRFKARGGLAVISKADLVDDETIELAQMEVREISKGSCLEGKPVIPFSAADRRGLDQILSAMENEANRVDGRPYSSSGHYKALKKQVIKVATEVLVHDVFKVAVSADELLSRLEPALDGVLVQRMLRELCSEGKLLPTDGGYRIPSLSVKLPSNRAKLADQMLEYARNLGFATFSARTFCEVHWKSFNVGEIRELLEYLRNRKKLVLLNDGRYLPSEAMEEIKKKVWELISRKGSLTIQDSWEILGYGRNRAVPVLEYLDSIGLTRRFEHARVLGLETPLKCSSRR